MDMKIDLHFYGIAVLARAGGLNEKEAPWSAAVEGFVIPPQAKLNYLSISAFQRQLSDSSYWIIAEKTYI